MTRRTGRAAVALSLLLAAFPAAADAGGRARNQYSLRVFQSVTPPGASSVMLGLADDGVGVGQVLFANGRSHPLLWDRRRIFDQASLVGGDGTFTAIDVLGYKVGNRKVNGTDFPFAVVGNTRVDLPRPGRALWVAPGGLVAVEGPGADGQPHVLLWQVANGSVRDLGPGQASAVNPSGVVVGRALSGRAAWWGPDGAMRELPFEGRLLRVNIANLASGYEVAGGGPKPITYDLVRGRRTRLGLPRGWPFGSAKVLTDAGRVAGIAVKRPQGGPPSQGVVWRGRRVVGPTELLGRPLPRGNTLADISAMTHGGLIAGALRRGRTAARAAGVVVQDQAFVAEPDTWYKLDELRDLVLARARLIVDSFPKRAEFLAIAEDLATMSDLLRLGRSRAACREVNEIGEHLFTVYESQILAISNPVDIALFDELLDGLDDFFFEEACARFRIRLNVPPALYPVAGQAPISVPKTQERPVTQEKIDTSRDNDRLKCDCQDTQAYISDLAIRQIGTRRNPGDSTRLEMKVNFKVDCTNGESGCLAAIELRPPRGATFLEGPTLGEGRTAAFFWCEGVCSRSTIIRRNLTWVALTKRGRLTVPNPRFTPGGRANRTLGLGWTTYCYGFGKGETKRSGEFGIHFDRLGQVDYRRSDLDDNDALDGGKLTDAKVFG